MLDLIAGDLWYLSLIRLPLLEVQYPSWSAIASLTNGRVLEVTAFSPDVILYKVVLAALTQPRVLLPRPTFLLNAVSQELRHLLPQRPRHLRANVDRAVWTATATLPNEQKVTAFGVLPDETLYNLIRLLSR